MHIICLLIFPTKTVVENNVLTLTCITYLRFKLTTTPIVIGEPEWCVMIQRTENTKFSHKHNVLYFMCTRPAGDH